MSSEVAYWENRQGSGQNKHRGSKNISGKPMLSTQRSHTQNAQTLVAIGWGWDHWAGTEVRMKSCCEGLLASLGPHPIGGWVCAAIWRASLGYTQLREAFAKDTLRRTKRKLWTRAHNAIPKIESL
eukprot:856801-Amphidinium_carterae.2